MNTIILLLSVFLAFWFGSLIISKTLLKNSISFFLYIMFAIGATGITAHFLGLY